MSRHSIAADIVWAFGLKDAKGATLLASAPESMTRLIEGALLLVRPVASAPSVGEILASLRRAGAEASPRVRRRLVAELESLVAQGTHGRAKRQERKRVVAELVVLLELETALGIAPLSPSTPLDARLSAVTRAVTEILRPRR